MDLSEFLSDRSKALIDPYLTVIVPFMPMAA